MNLGWICKLTSMCIKMAFKVSKSISKIQIKGWKKCGGDWKRIETTYLSIKWTFDATKKLKFKIFENFTDFHECWMDL